VTRLALSVVAFGAGLVLMAASGLGAPGRISTQGDVFRYGIDSDVDSVDPALAHDTRSWEILYATCSMLVNYPDAPAPRGARLVPDGAASMPQVSHDGRTYTFEIEKGRRFSDGSPITARSYQRALTRVLAPKMRSPGQDLFRDIFGAQAFVDGESKRVEGIAVLPGGRLRIQLKRRAPDFLARLAMPFACAVKPNQRVDPCGAGAPFVGSGPYFVAEWERNRALLLRRNQFYRGSRPRNVRAVAYGIGLSPATLRLQIEKGEIDHGSVPPAAYAEIGRAYGVRTASPGRFFVNPTGRIRYLAFNHERGLFGKRGGGPGAGLGNVRLKQAVNFAIDRWDLTRQLGAYGGSFTDQYLPPAMPGARNEAIYPVRPDLARARKLAQGHTRGGKGYLETCSYGPCIPIAEIVQENLKEIGLQIEIKAGPRSLVSCPPSARRRWATYDLLLCQGWRSDYFDPQGYLFLFDGRTIRATDNTNYAYFDSAEYNRKLARAASLTGQARYRAFGALDVDLARNAAPWAAYAVENDRRFFSSRVGGYFAHPVYGLDLAAIQVN
jgi:ABC-type oligopeptide transport system substrate-binding subunit